jgi:hypothetical protein
MANVKMGHCHTLADAHLQVQSPTLASFHFPGAKSSPHSGSPNCHRDVSIRLDVHRSYSIEERSQEEESKSRYEEQI